MSQVVSAATAQALAPNTFDIESTDEVSASHEVSLTSQLAAVQGYASLVFWLLAVLALLYAAHVINRDYRQPRERLLRAACDRRSLSK